MNIHKYYHQIRDQESILPTEWVWITSLETRNGGISGRVCETTRKNAAKMIVDGTAKVASRVEIDTELARIGGMQRRVTASLIHSFVVTKRAGSGKKGG